MKFRTREILLFVLIFSTFILSKAQTCSSDLVKLDVSVWSSKKGFLKDLTGTNFEIFEGRQAQTIESLTLADAPVTVGVMFDVSGSMQDSRDNFNKVAAAAEGFKTFLKNSRADNEYFFITFGKEKAVPLDFTQNPDQIQAALDQIKKVKPVDEKTLFHDALLLGLEKFSKAGHSKKVLFLVSDGVDHDSEAKFKDVSKLLRAQNIFIYTLNILSADSLIYGTYQTFLSISAVPVYERTFRDILGAGGGGGPMISNGFDNLEALSAETGGRVFYPVDSKEIVKAFETLSEELKSHYSLCFTPKNSKKSDEWRELDVKVVLPKEKRKGLGKILVRTKRGFYYL